ncbi:MAG: hypothetical protein K2M59_03690 [Muribaculaceae bacterium]|nr:hypothetical protein [Muribaculaceae bacterium]MDE7465512.1 hypothetical protein [Muribaculaceae bacterium]
MEANLIKRNGEVSMDKDFDLMCSLLRNGEYTVKIVRKTKPRTIPQNALMWMWYKCMEESTGQSKEDFHDYYKAKFLARQVVIGRRWVTVVGSTSDLNTLQMTEYLEKVKADAATEFGIKLPLPEDKNYQAFVSEYRLR